MVEILLDTVLKILPKSLQIFTEEFDAYTIGIKHNLILYGVCIVFHSNLMRSLSNSRRALYHCKLSDIFTGVILCRVRLELNPHPLKDTSATVISVGLMKPPAWVVALLVVMGGTFLLSIENITSYPSPANSWIIQLRATSELQHILRSR